MFKDLIAENKIENIIVFGDSNLAGCELHPNGTPEDYPPATWPHILGKKVNIPVHTYAKSGCSNDRSFRLLTEALLTHNKSYVIYGLIDWSRSEIFKKDIGYVPVGLCWTRTTGLDPIHKKVNDFYLENILINKDNEQKDNNYSILNHLIAVQSICKLHAVDYCIFPLGIKVLSLVKNKQTEILNLLDKGKIFSFHPDLEYNNWIHWASSKNFPMGKNHFLHKSHETFADLFFNNSKKV
jgi:hypothetical protein